MKEIGKLQIEMITYPVFFNKQDGKTYYLKNDAYFSIDWDWTSSSKPEKNNAKRLI